MRNRLITLVVLVLLVVTVVPASLPPVAAQDKPAPDKQEKKAPAKPEADKQEKAKSEKPSADKNPTAEQIAETVIAVYGARQGLAQIRRNGLERGRLTRTLGDGKTEEATYERRFIRGESTAKDKVRLDQKAPTAEYALIYGDGRVWGIVNGSYFTPREETSNVFLAQIWHDADALLRYKENGSTLAYVGKEKQKSLDLWVLDVTDKEQRRTRYYISAKSGRILWLEYEEPITAGGPPVKFKKTFHDYRYAQSTLVPFRTVLYQDDKQVLETQVLTVTYSVKMDETLFQSEAAAAATSQ